MCDDGHFEVNLKLMFVRPEVRRLLAQVNSVMKDVKFEPLKKRQAKKLRQRKK